MTTEPLKLDLNDPTYFILGDGLLKINLKTGEVTGSVENAGEAARIFVENIRAMLNPRPEAGDLVSRLRALVFTSPVMKGWPDWRPKADAAMTEAADFISRLSTAPTGDVVVVPRELVEAARAMPRSTPAPGGSSTVHDFKIEAGVVWALDKALRALDAAPTPSPQTSPVTEGEVTGWLIEWPNALKPDWCTNAQRMIEYVGAGATATPLYRSPPPAKAGEGELVHVNGVTMTPTAAANRIAELEAERDKLREALKSAREWLPCIEPIMHDTAIFKRDLDTIDRALSLKETAP